MKPGIILDKIMRHKRGEIARLKQIRPLETVRAEAEQAATLESPYDLVATLRAAGVSLIAEVKKASPSKRLLCPDFDAVRLAATYAANGAAVISVLTDDEFFQGKLEYLTCIRAAIHSSQPALPLLRKDFIFDPYQVYEARAAGADALLLITALLSSERLADLLSLTHKLGMNALVEVHNEAELARALEVEPRIVGVNNRNLKDFTIDLNTFGRLRPLLPRDTLAVAESGVHTAADVRRMEEMGADAVLVGEALVTADDTAAKVRELASGGNQ